MSFTKSYQRDITGIGSPILLMRKLSLRMLKGLAQITKRVRGTVKTFSLPPTGKDLSLGERVQEAPSTQLGPRSLLRSPPCATYLEELLHLGIHPLLHLQPALELTPVILHCQPDGSPGPGNLGGVGMCP